jgi:hypothetical protein
VKRENVIPGNKIRGNVKRQNVKPRNVIFGNEIRKNNEFRIGGGNKIRGNVTRGSVFSGKYIITSRCSTKQLRLLKFNKNNCAGLLNLMTFRQKILNISIFHFSSLLQKLYGGLSTKKKQKSL